MTGDELLDLFVISPVGIVSLDDDGTVAVANAAAKRLLHPFLRDGELSPFFDVLAPWAGDLGGRARALAEARGVVEEGRVMRLSSDREAGPALSLSLVKTGHGRFVALVTEVTELAAIESERTALTNRLLAIENGIRDYAIFMVDADGVVIQWSDSASRVHHSSAAEMIGQSMASLAPASAGGVRHVRAMLDAASKTGWIEEESFRLRRDGTQFWSSTIVTTLATPSGVARFQVITRDLSERRRLEAQLRDGVATPLDDLTGLTTRLGFFDTTATEIARARRYTNPLTLLLVDPDNFRTLNDEQGTAFGDDCLRAIAWVCRQESRTTDVIGRVGGEEFAVLLPSTELSGGLVLAERIRERMQRHLFPGDHSGVRCTVCVGVAELSEADATVDGLLALAQTAVQRAKSAGRNLVVGLDDSAP